MRETEHPGVCLLHPSFFFARGQLFLFLEGKRGNKFLAGPSQKQTRASFFFFYKSSPFYERKSSNISVLGNCVVTHLSLAANSTLAVLFWQTACLLWKNAFLFWKSGWTLEFFRQIVEHSQLFSVTVSTLKQVSTMEKKKWKSTRVEVVSPCWEYKSGRVDAVFSFWKTVW